MGHNGLPKKGEKIIFLKNAKMVGIFNGQQGMLSKDFEYDSHQNRYSGDMNYVNMDDIDDHDRAVEVGNRLKRLMKRTPDWRGHDEGVSWNDDGSYSFQRSNGTSVKLWHPAELESLHNRKVDVSIRKLIQLTDRRGREEPMRAWEYGLPTFDFGYALTCHKAQGSEWDCVLVYDEGVGSGVMRDPMMRRRWLYTAVTRAKEQLLWVVGGDGNNRYR
jgi:ATP-dependent exoDNAse (exonuclease V) alpha subunit